MNLFDLSDIGYSPQLLLRAVARTIKKILPEKLKKNFEPDSILGDAVGLGVLVILLAIVILSLRLYILYDR
jgi:hypothetical protein